MAIRNAKKAPISRPTSMALPSDGLRDEYQPIRTPAIRPLKVEPMTIDMICGAVSGAENRAVSPSNAPRTAPSRSPSRGLLIIIPGALPPDSRHAHSWGPIAPLRSRGSFARANSHITFCDRVPLPSTAREVRKRSPHYQIGGDQQDERPIFVEPPPGPFENRLWMRKDGGSGAVPGQVLGECAGVRIAVGWLG